MDMASTTLTLVVAGSKIDRWVEEHITTVYREVFSLIGGTGDYDFELSIPSGTTPTHRQYYSARSEDCTYSVSLDGFRNGNYHFHLHIGTRGWDTGKVWLTIHGEYLRENISPRSMVIQRPVELEKKDGGYSLLWSVKDLVPADWSNLGARVTAAVGSGKILHKLTNSATDPAATAPGNHLWVKYSDTEAPAIKNLVPTDGERLISSTVDIFAEFSDGDGTGVDLDSFRLAINPGTPHEILVDKNTPKNKGLIKFSEAGFQFRSITPFKNQVHNALLRLADKHGNVTERVFSFLVDVKLFNAKVGALPIAALSGVGGAVANTLKNAGVETVGGLVNADPVQLAKTTGISVKTLAAAVSRSRLACTQVRFIEGDFPELLPLTINQIVTKTNEQLYDLDIPREDWQEVENIRGNIGILYTCLDAPVVDALKFADLVWRGD